MSAEDLASGGYGSLSIKSYRQVHVEWKVKNFYERLKSSNDHYLDSATFSFNDAKCSLRICRNSGHTCNLGKYYLYTKNVSSTLDHPIPYTIGIKSVDGSVFKTSDGEIFNEKIFKRHEFSALELEDSMHTIAPDGFLRVFLTTRNQDRIPTHSTVEVASQTSSDGLEILSQNFKDLFVSETDGDVTFEVNNEKFVAHKLVLAARSAVFQAIFLSVETESGVVKIEDSDPASFKCLLIYIYSGNLDVVSSDNAVALYLLAKKYELKELKVACAECMAQDLSTDSFCDVVHFASIHDDFDLLEKATQYFAKHADTILSTPKWFSFLTEHPTLANDLYLKGINIYIK